MSRKPTREQWTQFHAINAPPGFDMETLPKFMRPSPSKRQPAKPKKDRSYRESDLQRECVRWLRHNCPDILFWHTPNSLFSPRTGSRADEGKRLWYLSQQKEVGLLPGVSDLILIFRSKHGATTIAAAELKAGNNQPTEAQIAFMEKGNNLGMFTSVVKSLDDLKKLLFTSGYQLK
jgi:hypothetical protein